MRSCLFARFERAEDEHVRPIRQPRCRSTRCPNAAGGVADGAAGGAAGEAGVETGSGVSSAMRAAVLLQSWTGSAGSGRDEMERARRGHSGHAGCAVRRCGVYSSERAGCRGAGGAATSSCMPLIVQPQSERGVCAGTSTRMKSWPLCLHARGTHAMNTQICALLSLLVTAERASTGVSVHQCNQAQVSWISKQPGIDGRYGAREAYRQGLVTRHRLGHARWRPGPGFGPHIAQRWPFCWPARPARRQWRNLLSEAHKVR